MPCLDRALSFTFESVWAESLYILFVLACKVFFKAKGILCYSKFRIIKVVKVLDAVLVKLQESEIGN